MRGRKTARYELCGKCLLRWKYGSKVSCGWLFGTSPMTTVIASGESSGRGSECYYSPLSNHSRCAVRHHNKRLWGSLDRGVGLEPTPSSGVDASSGSSSTVKLPSDTLSSHLTSLRAKDAREMFIFGGLRLKSHIFELRLRRRRRHQLSRK